jgi:hypothetical protein
MLADSSGAELRRLPSSTIRHEHTTRTAFITPQANAGACT